jgi:dinuclear metal center YbgI/SA1388 family protein
LSDIGRFLGEIAPLRLAESWDNVGLLVGDHRQPVRRIMTCLTIIPATVAEAIASAADLIVTHHPLPFSPLKRITSETTAGQLLLDLIAARIAVYSAHTAWDSAAEGINQQLAEGLKLRGIQPLVPHPTGQGFGRYGWLEEPTTLQDFALRLKDLLRIERLQLVGHNDNILRTIGVACGSAGELLPAACAAGCEAFVVGETRFHTCLEAEASGVSLLLPGHYASERFSMDLLADRLGKQFSAVETWASREERDPLRWIE